MYAAQIRSVVGERRTLVLSPHYDVMGPYVCTLYIRRVHAYKPPAAEPGPAPVTKVNRSQKGSNIAGMNAELLREFFIGDMSVFVCYAHKDNESSDPSKRWLDRLLEFLRPLTRYGNVTPWSDTDIPVGGPWEAAIEEALDRAKAAVLLVTPALLDSEYIFRSEVPVLLKRAKERGMKILPILVEPSLYHKARFKYPDWKSGPHELLLGSLQSINPPSRTLIDMEKAEQNRVFLQVAEQLEQWLEEDRVRTEQEAARAKEQEERERAARLESMKREIEEASSLETSRHTFIGDICSGCRLNVMTIAHFKKYRCSKMFDENS